jgi:hypothetical protein
LLEHITHDISQLNDEENSSLTAAFTEKEVHEAICQMKLNKAPGPGFQTEFYQKNWEVIKRDFMAMFSQLHSYDLQFV